MGAAGQIRIHAIAEAGETEVVEARDLGLCKALVADVRQRRATPERQSLPQCRRRLPRLTRRELAPAAPEERLEARGVDVILTGTQRVAAALGKHHALSESGPEPGRHDVDGLLRVLRPAVVPQLVDRPIDVHDRSSRHQEQGEERKRAAARHTDRPTPWGIDFDRPEDPELGVHLECSLVRCE